MWSIVRSSSLFQFIGWKILPWDFSDCVIPYFSFYFQAFNASMHVKFGMKFFHIFISLLIYHKTLSYIHNENPSVEPWNRRILTRAWSTKSAFQRSFFLLLSTIRPIVVSFFVRLLLAVILPHSACTYGKADWINHLFAFKLCVTQTMFLCTNAIGCTINSYWRSWTPMHNEWCFCTYWYGVKVFRVLTPSSA